MVFNFLNVITMRHGALIWWSFCANSSVAFPRYWTNNLNLSLSSILCIATLVSMSMLYVTPSVSELEDVSDRFNTLSSFSGTLSFWIILVRVSWIMGS